MIELHGWITIRETYGEDSCEDDTWDICIDKIKNEIKNLSYFKPQMRALNGARFLEFTIFCNRRNQETEEVFKFFSKIGELAVGSYGLIYLHDDEAEGKENQFQVFSLSKGNIKEYKDYFLSPIVPTIEDEFVF